MSLPLVIMASASPRRAELVRELGFEFEIVPSDVPELEDDNLTAGELCQVNAYRKARAVSKKFPDALVLGVDTLVTLGTKIYGKPPNKAAAQKMIEELQGKTHEVVTGVCMVHLRTHHEKIFVERTRVAFRRLSLEQIKAYLEKINPLDKAGGYAIQEHGEEIVKGIEGSYSNVVGLPIERLRHELAEFETLLLATA